MPQVFSSTSAEVPQPMGEVEIMAQLVPLEKADRDTRRCYFKQPSIDEIVCANYLSDVYGGYDIFERSRRIPECMASMESRLFDPTVTKSSVAWKLQYSSYVPFDGNLRINKFIGKLKAILMSSPVANISFHCNRFFKYLLGYSKGAINWQKSYQFLKNIAFLIVKWIRAHRKTSMGISRMPRGRRFANISGRLNVLTWHKEKKILIEGSSVSNCVALHLMNDECRRIGLTVKILPIFSDVPCNTSIYKMEDTKTDDAEVYASYLFPGATKCPRKSVCGRFTIERKSMGLRGSVKVGDRKMAEVDANAFTGIDMTLSREAIERRNVGVRCVSIAPWNYDTIIAVGLSDGFEVWNKSSDYVGELNKHWLCIFWHTMSVRKSINVKGIIDSLLIDGATSMDWSPDGRLLAVTSRSEIFLWPIETLNQKYANIAYEDLPRCMEPTILRPNYVKTALGNGDICDIRWARHRPMLACLISSGYLEIYDTTIWKSKIWSIPTSRSNPIIPRMQWHGTEAVLIVSTEKEMYHLQFGAENRMKTDPVNCLDYTSYESNKHSYTIDDKILEFTKLQIAMTHTNDTDNNDMSVRAQLIYFHPDDKPDKNIWSFSVDPRSGIRLAVTYESVSYVYLYQYTGELDHFPIASLIGRIPCPKGVNEWVFPHQVEFAPSHSPQLNNNVRCEEDNTSMLAVRWGIKVYPDYNIRNDNLACEEETKACVPIDQIPDDLHLKHLVDRRKLLNWKSYSNNDDDYFYDNPNWRAAIWPVMTVVYPLHIEKI